MFVCPRHLYVYRRELYGDFGDAQNGYMVIPARSLAIVFSNGEGWEHVSVSRPDRCPTWDEMEWAKQQFWSEDETVMQLHVPRAEHVNYHPHCLHLWRPVGVVVPRPPAWMVGPSGK